MSSFEVIQWQALQSGLSPAVSIPNRVPNVVSYSRLAFQVKQAASHLQRMELAPNAIIGLRIDDILLHIVLTLAVDYLGLASVALPGDDFHGIKVDLLVTDRPDVTGTISCVQVSDDWLSAELGQVPPAEYRPSEASDIQRILLTSGTTGQPKAVAMTRAMVEARLHSYEYVFGHTFAQVDRMLCCMGLGSSIGYLFLLYCLSRGKMYCAPSAEIGDTWRRSQLYNIEAIVASPVTLADIWAQSWKENVQWSGLKLILTAGGHLPKKLNDRVKQWLCNRIVNFYGSTETGVVAVANTELLDLEDGENGYICPGMTVRILPLANGNVLSNGEGRLSIESAANATGYIGSPDNEYFENGAFFPGDIAIVSDDGMLSIKGRESSVVNIGGIKTTIENIEKALSAAPGIDNLSVFTVSDALGIARVRLFIQPTETWREESFWEFCYANVSKEYWPIKIETVRQFPIAGNGKIDRQALLAMNG